MFLKGLRHTNIWLVNDTTPSKKVNYNLIIFFGQDFYFVMVKWESSIKSIGIKIHKVEQILRVYSTHIQYTEAKK